MEDQVIRCVSVRFTQELALYEPKKFVKILEEGIAYPELDRRFDRKQLITGWPSEYTDSLNLVVRFNPLIAEEDQLTQIQRAFPGAVKATFFGNEVVAKQAIERTLHTVPTGKVLIFRKAA
jgi:hypothetical protein